MIDASASVLYARELPREAVAPEDEEAAIIERKSAEEHATARVVALIEAILNSKTNTLGGELHAYGSEKGPGPEPDDEN